MSTLSTKTAIKSQGDKGEQKIKKNTMVEIEGTGSSAHLPKGKTATVHQIHGQTLIDKGAAVKVRDVEAKPLRARGGK